MGTRSPFSRVMGGWRMILWGSVVVVCLSAYWSGLRLNLSPSLPRGVYRLTAVPPVCTHHQLVTIPVPPSVRSFVAWWVPILKPVAGVPGDVVCYEDGRLTIQGDDYGPVSTEAHGRPVPTIPPGCQTIPEGHLFLASHAPRSLDSRYFSFVALSSITAGATPVWTWE